MFNSRMSKLFIFVVVALILATSAYAFAASNTVPGTVAGEGAAVVSGYTVTNVAYTLDATPSKIDSVAFTLSGPATTVEASLTGSGAFYCGIQSQKICLLGNFPDQLHDFANTACSRGEAINGHACRASARFCVG